MLHGARYPASWNNKGCHDACRWVGGTTLAIRSDQIRSVDGVCLGREGEMMRVLVGAQWGFRRAMD